MAMAILLAFAPTVVDNTISPIYRYTIAPIVRHICYPFKYKSNVENLNNKLNDLKEKRDTVQHSVDQERRNGKSIENGVEAWLGEVDKITERIEGDRIKGEERAKKKCFEIGFCCPSLKNRYQLSRKATKEALAVAHLQENSKFDDISYSTVPQPNLVSGDELPLQSRISIVKEIMAALMVPDINTIGVYGTGGVGKSTIVQQVAQQTTDEKLFGEVVMATITQTLDVRKIQRQLADMLGLKFEAEESDWGRAARLRERLKLKETVLVVLDDLWETIDLKTVGIPTKEEHKGCKILLTSRDKNILSSGMGCQKDFGVDYLTEEEAWYLFKKKAGDNFEDPEVQSAAVDVAKECARLPVAIVTVAKALKNKNLSVWQNALQELKRPSIENFTGVPNQVYSCIEFSYNHIESMELKSLFLLCGRIIGHNASIHYLLKHVVGLGLFPNVVSIKAARVRMEALLLKLKDSCLLLDNDSNDRFAMHDLVRDVAISIAIRDHHVIVANEEVELHLFGKERQNQATQIWSRCYIAEHLKDLKCPQLELFQMFNGDPDPHILHDNIFEGMQKLQVLNLTNFSFSSLPSSLRLLNNLQTLCLDQSVLGDITIIGELINLEILSFVECNIEELPVEVSQLTKLKLLDLSDCSELKVIPQNVISKLSRLEELYMGNSFQQWHLEGSNNARISELENLTHLSNLDIHIRDPRVMSKDMFSERLQRYRIFIGDVWDWGGVYETSRTLKLKLDTSTSPLEYGVQMLLKKTEDLYVLGLNGVENSICELDREGFPQLKHLRLQSSPEIQYIVDTMEGVQSNPFPVLESLVLDDLMSLEKIYHGALEAESPFSKLKILEVENCYKLKYLFSFSLARCLSQLQNFKVTNCPILEEIVFEEEEEFEMKNKAVNVIKFTELRSVLLKRLPRFRNFCSIKKAPCLSETNSNTLGTTTGSGEIISEDVLRSPTPFFNEKIVFPNLVDLELHSINIETLWHHGAFSIQNLQRLHVESCDGLKYIFSAAMVKSLLQLKHLSVRSCEDVEEIIVAEEGLHEEEMMTELLFPQLDYIELYCLPELRRFSTGHAIDCPLLTRLRIVYCHKLDTFVSNFESANIVSNEYSEVNLEEKGHNSVQPLFNEKVAVASLAAFEIGSMNVEKIWYNRLAEDSFRKLRILTIRECNKLVKIFPSNLLRRFQRLEVLKIEFCSSLEEIFELQELCAEETRTSYAFQLKVLELFFLPKLKHIWNKDPQRMLNFHNLHRVAVCHCRDLKKIFPFPIARDLPQLETLRISYSGVEEIVETMEENGHEEPCFVFPRLKNLELQGLTKFRKFYSTKHTWNCPMLKSLEVAGDCGNVKVFGSKNHGKVHHDGTIQEPLFDVEKVISNLEELSLDGKGPTTSIIWSCQLPTKFRSTMKVLKLANFMGRSDPVPFGFLQRLQNLETLSITSCSLKNMFLYERAGNDEEGNLALLPKIRNLMIDSVDDDVSHLWEQDHWLVPVLQNLRTLNVSWCDKLVNLAPSSASFQDLTTLDVHGCDHLLHLITPSTARSLRQLVKLSIRISSIVTEIVAKQEDETEDEIIFSRLEYLELVRLYNLTSFCSRNYTFKFPSLKEMVVEHCHKMSFFSRGAVSAPKLPGVRWQRDLKNKQFWKGNLDNTIRQMYIEMVGLNNLSLSGFPRLKETWLTQPPLKSFVNIWSLTVDECPSFSVAIPTNVLQLLSNLRTLIVSKCDSLEEVFDLGGLNAEAGLLPNLFNLCLTDLPRLRHICNRDPQGILDFKNLTNMTVHNCGSLRNILTPSIVLGLVQLERIEIKTCDMMEEVITKERSDDDIAAADKIRFPLLREIIFESLPNLTCIFPGSGNLEFPSLEKIRVHSCPKMKTFIHSLMREQELNSGIEEIEHRPDYKCQVAIPNLKQLELDWKDIMKEIWHGRFRDDLFQKLKVLKLARFPEEYTVFPSRSLGRFTNLVKLSVSDAYFEVIVQQEETNGEESHDGVLPRLQELYLSKLPKLVHLSKEDPLPCLAFQNLKALEVSQCQNLKILSPSAVSFQCLTRLEITKCHGLMKLMTFSTARFLVELTSLTVSECELIDEIVANKDNEAENEIIFQALRSLSLDRLPRLTSFYLGKCAFMFPSLITVQVENCPKMETFSRGFISTPELDRILLKVDDNEWNWEGDLNTSIQKMFTDMGDGVEQSKLSSSHQATVGNGSTQAEKIKMHAASDEGLASDDLPVIENPDTDKDLLPVVEPAIETEILGSNGVLKEPEINQLDSIYHGTLEDKDQVLHASSSIDQCVEGPKCPITKQAPPLASASPTKRSTKEQFTSATASNFESLYSSVGQLLNPNQPSSPESTTNSTLACETTKVDGDIPTAVCETQTSEDLHVKGTLQTSKHLPSVVETIYRPEEHMLKGALREPEINLSAKDFLATSYVKDEPQQDIGNTFTLVEQVSAASPIKTVSSEELTSGTTSEPASGSSSSMQEDPKVDLEIQISLRVQKFHSSTEMAHLGNVITAISLQQGNTIPITSEDFPVTGPSETSKDMSPVVETIIRTKENRSSVLREPEMTPLAQDLYAASYDKDLPHQVTMSTTGSLIKTVSSQELTSGTASEVASGRSSSMRKDPAEAQNSPATVDETTISHQILKFSPKTEKSNTILMSSSTPGEQVPVSTSVSPTNKTSSQERNFGPTSRAASVIPAIPMSSHSAVENFESLFASMEKLINTSPAASSALASSSDTHAEYQESDGVSFESYIYSLALVKKILMKSPEVVAISVDRLLLLASLKNLKNSHFLSSQQQEIVQVYIENFNTLVSGQPFDEKKSDWTSSIKFSIEDGNRSIADLKTSYEDLTSKASRLNAEQEALMKRLHEIEEEKDRISVNKEGLYAELVSKKGKIETHMNALVEAERQRREAEDKAAYIDDYWAKFRSLFA